MPFVDFGKPNFDTLFCWLHPRKLTWQIFLFHRRYIRLKKGGFSSRWVSCFFFRRNMKPMVDPKYLHELWVKKSQQNNTPKTWVNYHGSFFMKLVTAKPSGHCHPAILRQFPSLQEKNHTTQKNVTDSRPEQPIILGLSKSSKPWLLKKLSSFTSDSIARYRLLFESTCLVHFFEVRMRWGVVGWYYEWVYKKKC